MTKLTTLITFFERNGYRYKKMSKKQSQSSTIDEEINNRINKWINKEDKDEKLNHTKCLELKKTVKNLTSIIEKLKKKGVKTRRKVQKKNRSRETVLPSK